MISCTGLQCYYTSSNFISASCRFQFNSFEMKSMLSILNLHARTTPNIMHMLRLIHITCIYSVMHTSTIQYTMYYTYCQLTHEQGPTILTIYLEEVHGPTSRSSWKKPLKTEFKLTKLFMKCSRMQTFTAIADATMISFEPLCVNCFEPFSLVHMYIAASSQYCEKARLYLPVT